MREGEIVFSILWHANPFRGDKFEDAWRAAAEAALDYGATWWAFYRSMDDPLDFTQVAIFPSKLDFERYWYSEELAEARANASGLYQVPVLPQSFRVVGTGAIAEPEEAEAGQQA